MRRRFEDPAEREKTSAGQLRRFEDPAERAKMSEHMRHRFEDPAERARCRSTLVITLKTRRSGPKFHRVPPPPPQRPNGA